MKNFKVESRHMKTFYKFMAFIRCMKAVFYKPDNQSSWAFETISRAFETLAWAFETLGQAFEGSKES